MSLQIVVIETKSLGDCSYLIHDGKSGLVIDPQRDIDRIESLLDKESIDLVAVAETHIHNDYLSGGMALAQRHGAHYLLNADDSVNFNPIGIRDLEIVSVGSFAIKAIHAPGHTFNHMAYALIDSNEKTVGLFSGGSLLHGSTGRPDLLGWESAEKLAGLQHSSAHHLARLIPDNVQLYPTHGLGSFCSTTPTTTTSSTVGDERVANPVFLQPKKQYVKSTLSALDKFPTYFNYMASVNSFGAPLFDLTPIPRVTLSEINTAIADGAWVVDLRTRAEWCSRHFIGSRSFGLDGSFASYMGWLLPPERELFLISDKALDIAEAERELVRIGIERFAGSWVGDFAEVGELSSIQSALFRDFPRPISGIKKVFLDIRTPMEYSVSHIAGAIHIPFYEVEERVEELPNDCEIWVHCASGYRAATVISLIESSGRIAVLVNEDFSPESLAHIPGIEIRVGEKLTHPDFSNLKK